jgi:small-conductance mechanosensitive channel
MRSKSAVLSLSALSGVMLFAQPPQPPVPVQNPLTANQVIIHLTRTIAWYQHLSALDDGSSITENVLLRNNAREFAKHALQSSFAFARAQTAVLNTTPDSSEPTTAAPASMQQSLTKASARVVRLQQRLQSLDARIDQATGAQKQALVDERGAIAADLALAKQMETAVRTITSFSSPKNASSHGLLDVINSLESLNPVSTPSADDKEKTRTTTTPNESTYHPESDGIVVLASKAMSFYSTRGQIETVRNETNRLADSVDSLRAPLRQSVKAIVAESDAISNSEDNAVQASQWIDTSKQISELGVRFKQLSTVVIPLGETAMSLQSVRGSLDEWRKQLDSNYTSAVRYLTVRLAVLLGGAVFILLASAIWQRAIYRYVTEPRRRRQLLLVKRVVVGLALAVLLTFGFFSSLASVATLLGFITAGVALALQNVILSAVAYFFLIGRYGLKVGDRVTVQGVTGEVIEVGFIRLFLMEMIGTGTESHASGRLAVFANSVIFQPAALMKQAPGIDYTWHAVTATVEDPSDHQQARARLTQAVSAVYEEYRLAIEQQHKAFEQSTQIPSNSPVPSSRIQFTEHGLEITIRFPVSLNEQPGQIDEQVVDGIIAEADKEPKLKFANGGSPKTSQVM